MPDQVVSELRSRERGGLITLPPKPPPTPFAPGDRLRVHSGPFTGLHGLYAGQAPRDRVLVLLQMLGGLQRVEMPAQNVARI